MELDIYRGVSGHVNIFDSGVRSSYTRKNQNMIARVYRDPNTGEVIFCDTFYRRLYYAIAKSMLPWLPESELKKYLLYKGDQEVEK